MAVSTTPRLGLTRWSAGTDPHTRAQMDTSFANLEQWAGRFEQGTTAARPAAGIRDRYYFDTDTSVLYRDSGTAWTALAASILGPVTRQAAPGQTGALVQWKDPAGAVMAIMRPDGKLMIRPRGTEPLAKSVAEFTTPTADSRVTLGEGTAGGNDPAVTFYRTAAGNPSGLAYRIRQPNSFDPLLVEASTGGDVAYGTEAYVTRLRVGPGNHTGHRGLEVWGIAGQTGDLLQLLTSDGTVVARVNSAGQISSAVIFADNVAGVGAHGLVGGGVNMKVGATATGVVPVAVAGQAGQTADLQRWQDSAGTVLARITAAGNIEAPNLTGAWTQTNPEFRVAGVASAHTFQTKVLRYKRVGNIVHFSVFLRFGSNAIEAGLFSLAGLPAGAFSSGIANCLITMNDASPVTRRSGYGILNGTNIAEMYAPAGGSTDQLAISNTHPWTWANGDTLTISGTYEAS